MPSLATITNGNAFPALPIRTRELIPLVVVVANTAGDYLLGAKVNTTAPSTGERHALPTALEIVRWNKLLVLRITNYNNIKRLKIWRYSPAGPG